jgi:hypothetical protein
MWYDVFLKEDSYLESNKEYLLVLWTIYKSQKIVLLVLFFIVVQNFFVQCV